MKTLIGVVMVLVLSGCATGQWYKDGITPSQFEQDKQRCIYEVQLHNPNMFLEALPLVAQCMRAKGYVQVPR